MKNRYIICGILFLGLISVVGLGCGKDEGVTAPSGSTITVNPASLSPTISGDTPFNFTIFVTNDQGKPMQNAEVYITGPFAAPRSPARYQFYRKAQGQEPVNSGFTVKTDESGTYTFSIIIPVTVNGAPNAFTDSIELRSGSAFQSINITLS